MRRALPLACLFITLLLKPTSIPAAEAEAEGLRAAILDLSQSYGERYPKGAEYLARLDTIQQRANSASPAERPAIDRDFEQLRREALIANPLVSGQPILFVVRPQYRPDHHNTETMFQTGEINTGSFEGGSALVLIDFAQGSKMKTIIEVPKGIVRDPEIHFDGKKILVSLRHDRADDYHLYEVNADGSGLKQLTFGSGISDIDPIYLPSGEIVFTSTREPKYCMCNRHIMGNLFKMEGNGANIHQIAHSTLHEGHSALLPDGRILYDRWEYVDRNFGNAQGLWTVNPDGTHPIVWYGNSTDSPGGVLDARPIPGTQQVICTFSSCHDRPWGALAILDRRHGVDNRPAVVRTWPADAIQLVDVGNYDTFTRVHPKYEDPFPLSDKYFLCSRMTGKGERMGLYLLDIFGNEILLYGEGPGCYDAMPLIARTPPPVVPARIDSAREEGTMFVADVYRGSGMEAIPRGTVKRMRIVESPEKRFWTHPAWDGGTGQQAPGMAWDDFNNKRIVGTVPVEPDGSAHFNLPADTFVYFQLLDERRRMVQTMRSGTIARPGETTGCVGCHEGRRTAVPLLPRPASGGAAMPLAMRRPPSPIQSWYGPPRLFNYAAEVQPVFDKHCVSCHDFGQEAGKKLNLAGDRTLIFNTSYIELRSKQYVKAIGAGPPQVLPPKTWGSSVSRLAEVMLDGHKNVEIDRQIKLGDEDRDRVITWIDINAPYYPEYATSYPDHLYGRAPLNDQQIRRLSDLVGVNLADRGSVAMVSFARPELSPCLARLDKAGANYREALATIAAGKTAFEKNPAADMPGFRLTCPSDVARQAKYEALLQSPGSPRQTAREN